MYGRANRKCSENGEVIRWCTVGHRERGCKGRVRGGKVEDVIFVMCWEIYVLSEVERGQKRKKLGSVVVCRIV